MEKFSISNIKKSLTDKAKLVITSDQFKQTILKEGYVDSPDNAEPALSKDEQDEIINKRKRHKEQGSNNDDVEAHSKEGRKRVDPINEDIDIIKKLEDGKKKGVSIELGDRQSFDLDPETAGELLDKVKGNPKAINTAIKKGNAAFLKFLDKTL